MSSSKPSPKKPAAKSKAEIAPPVKIVDTQKDQHAKPGTEETPAKSTKEAHVSSPPSAKPSHETTLEPTAKPEAKAPAKPEAKAPAKPEAKAPAKPEAIANELAPAKGPKKDRNSKEAKKVEEPVSSIKSIDPNKRRIDTPEIQEKIRELIKLAKSRTI